MSKADNPIRFWIGVVVLLGISIYPHYSPLSSFVFVGF